MSIDIQIVDAVTADANAIGQIQSQTFRCYYPNPSLGINKEDIEVKVKGWEEQGDSRIIGEMQKEGAKTWVAKDKDKIVGFIAAFKKEDGSIESLHVYPDYQGQGIGTRLLEVALDWLGDRRITIEVVSYNERAKALYKKFGFVEEKSNLEGIPLGNGKIIPKILMAKNTGINPVVAGVVGATVGAAVGVAAVELADEKNREAVGKKLEHITEELRDKVEDVKGNIETKVKK